MAAAIESGRGVFSGPAGDLEYDFALPKDAAVGAALVCHPHPVHGGTLDNKVAYMLARACNDAGLAALRFNFRGVGKSAGRFDDGNGELDDARAALTALQAAQPDLPVVLCGFSFGAAISLRLAVEQEPSKLVSIAPPLFYFDGADIPQPACPWLLVHGLADEVVDAQDTRERLDSLERPPAEQHWLPEVGHFFHGQLSGLRRIVADSLQAHFA